MKFGLWLAIPEPLIVEAAARAGSDWVGLDMQHGGWDLGTVFRALQLLSAFGREAIVRVSEQELEAMPRVLDHGASGVIIAMASSPELAAETVQRARYQPEGVRSFGGQRFGMHPAPARAADIRPNVYPMIEDRRGFEKVEAIAAVKGIAGLHVGPVDLGLGLGLDRGEPKYTEAVRRIVAAGHAAKVPVTMHAVKPTEVERWRDVGVDEVVLTADIELLRFAFDDALATARRQTGAVPLPQRRGTYDV